MTRLCEFDGRLKCIHCGRKAPMACVRVCTSDTAPEIQRKTISLIDYNVRSGHHIPAAMLRLPCQHLGAKRFLRSGEPQLAKLSCGTNSFTPVYECGVFRRATPFGRCLEGEADAEFVHSCVECPRYLKPYPVPAPVIELHKSP